VKCPLGPGRSNQAISPKSRTPRYFMNSSLCSCCVKTVAMLSMFPCLVQRGRHPPEEGLYTHLSRNWARRFLYSLLVRNKPYVLSPILLWRVSCTAFLVGQPTAGSVVTTAAGGRVASGLFPCPELLSP